jgi:hypothetical protein
LRKINSKNKWMQKKKKKEKKEKKGGAPHRELK